MRTSRRIPLVVFSVLAGASIGYALRRPAGGPERMARELAAAVSPERMLAELDVLAARPHRAGTAANAAVADEVVKRLRQAGYEPTVEGHDVEVWEPLELKLSITGPDPLALDLDLHERALPEDPQSAVAHDELPFFAFSPDADVTARVVYASFGAREDYELLLSRDIDPRGKLALVRAQGTCRGRKAEIAAEFGVRGLLVYPELRDQGPIRKEPYPDGPQLNDHTAQRGSLLLYHRQPGPPGPSGAPLPPVPAIPLTPFAAKELLKRIEGDAAPPGWTGWMPVPYRIGAGPAEARLVVRGRRERRRIRNVFALLPGEVEAAAPVVVGSHLDAWVYGAVDPTSGVVAVLEAARVLRRQRLSWWKPARGTLFAFWDGEEYGMFGSTLWVSPRTADPYRSVAAYVNVDSAARAREFLGNVTPLLRTPLLEALDLVDEPGSGRKLGELAGELQLPGFGSDTAPFSGLAGVPVAEVGFGRSYPVYHSVYDSIRWLNRFGDPGAKRRAALVQVIGVYLADLTRGNVLPWRLSEIADDTGRELDGLVRNARALPQALARSMAELRQATEAHGRSARELERRLERRAWRVRGDGETVNSHLVAALTAFSTRPRPAFGKCDLLFGPSPEAGCSGARFPELTPALVARDEAAVALAAARLRGAFEASRRELESASRFLER